MAKYIEAVKSAEIISEKLNIPLGDLVDIFADIPTADGAEVKHKNTDDENCVICNCNNDEKGAGGIWDLAGEICEVLMVENDHEEQDTIYNIIREYIEEQRYCPHCGAKMNSTPQKEGVE